MTNLFAGYRPAFQPFTPLEQAIYRGNHFGVITYNSQGPTEIKAPLRSIADSVEAAYVLTPREALPKVTATVDLLGTRKFTGTNGLGATITGGNSESARQSAALWLAIAGLLEAEEKKAADEAKTKAAAEKAKENARLKRLDELADEHFEEYFEDLGPKKTTAIEEIYRLEQVIAEEDAA